MQTNAFLDANILYPQLLRDLFLSLAHAKLYRPFWTDQVQDEWVRNVLKNHPYLTSEALSRTCGMMDLAFPESRVVGYESKIDEIVLPDAEDRHVVAAASTLISPKIVTFNLRHFPPAVLSPLGIEAVHPDAFLLSLLDSHDVAVFHAIRAMRLRLKHPPKSAVSLIDDFHRNHLKHTALRLNPFADQL